jgi:periplasmic divalent cation tolerance protein
MVGGRRSTVVPRPSSVVCRRSSVIITSTLPPRKGVTRVDVQYVVVLITAPSTEVAQQIAAALVEQRLAACVNQLTPIQSQFIWQGKVNNEEEVLLMVKTRADLFKEQLIPAVLAVHPYEVPEIIALPIVMGLDSYLDWIAEVTASGQEAAPGE